MQSKNNFRKKNFKNEVGPYICAHFDPQSTLMTVLQTGFLNRPFA